MRSEALAALDRNAIASGLFLPLLFWTGSVIAISLMGYPGIVCTTPVAWVLALPVGLRVGRESVSTPGRQRVEAALAGGMLGFWQGLLIPAVMAASPWLPGQSTAISDLPSPYLVGCVGVLLSAPVTAGLAALMAWRVSTLGNNH